MIRVAVDLSQESFSALSVYNNIQKQQQQNSSKDSRSNC